MSSSDQSWRQPARLAADLALALWVLILATQYLGGPLLGALGGWLAS